MTSQVVGSRARLASLSNRRTGFVLLTIALAFFVGVIVKYWLLNAG